MRSLLNHPIFQLGTVSPTPSNLDQEVTLLTLKSIIFWDMTPCSPLSFNRRSGETYRLHLQGRRKGSANHEQADGKRYVPPKRRLKLNGLHGVISQKMILFITTAVKTSNPTILSLFSGRTAIESYPGRSDFW
jgi:hypothetical protein